MPQQKQPQDPHGQQTKRLVSAVQRLRGWVGTDPSRTPDLADALVELSAHRLLGHAYAEAVADAQEAVALSGKLLTEHGPIGPYTSSRDATRYVTAAVHVATIQGGLGLAEAGGRTVQGALDLKNQLPRLQLAAELAPRTVIWALAAQARARLAVADAGGACAYADAARARLDEAGLASSPDAGYLAMDVARLVADCRWSAGWVEEALEEGHRAKAQYDGLVAGRLREPGRLSPALLARLAEPLFGVYRDVADRLVATGDLDRGLVIRRSLIDLLRVLSPRLDATAPAQLARSLADLSSDLLLEDRVDEAVEAAAEAEASALELKVPGVESTQLLTGAALARAFTRQGRVDEAVALLEEITGVDGLAERAGAAHAVALGVLAECHRERGDLVAADAGRRAFEAAAGSVLRGTAVPENVSLPAVVADRARGALTRRAQPVARWAELDDDRAFAATTASAQRSREDEAARAAAHREAEARAEAERAEAHRLEQQRQNAAREEATRREAERREAERVAAEQAAADRLATERAEADRAAAVRMEAERRAAEEEVARHESQRRREQRIEAHRLEVERLEAERLAAEHRAAELARAAAEQRDEVAVAQRAWQEAKASGDRRRTRVENERLVELLRPRAQADPEQYASDLLYALEQLAGARLRSGDWFGSRGPAKEAKALAKIIRR